VLWLIHEKGQRQANGGASYVDDWIIHWRLVRDPKNKGESLDLVSNKITWKTQALF